MSAAPVNLAAELAAVAEPWRPRVVAALNGQEVKVVKLRGAFPWHAHADADELFWCLEGSLRIELEGRGPVELNPGELFVVPRGVRHRPVAGGEGGNPGDCEVALFEPAGVVNTGDAAPSAFTAPSPGPVPADPTPLDPRREPGEYVFVALPGAAYGDGADLNPVAAVREGGGLALVVPRADADAAGLDHDGTFALISLGMNSGVTDVGLTAAVSAALAGRGIACNVLAGFARDHLLVPADRAGEAVRVLARVRWAAAATQAAPGAGGA